MASDPYALIAAALEADPRVRLVYAFGSAVHRPSGARDLDVAVLVDRKLSWDEERQLRADVAGADPRADLVILNDAAPVLRYEVVTTGRCLLARDPDERAEFEIVSLSRFLDLEPMRRVQDAYRRERVEARRGPAR